MSPFELGQPWRKLLYVKQGFPDNYVDKTFLDALQKNVNVRAHKYWPTVLRTCAVSQHISGITAFIAVLVHRYSGVLAPDRLMMWDAVGRPRRFGQVARRIGSARWSAAPRILSGPGHAGGVILVWYQRRVCTLERMLCMAGRGRSSTLLHTKGWEQGVAAPTFWVETYRDQ
ncbi:phosphatidylinositol N-acetylglucosaminyltransferase-domain-containing protein [Fimicolochytrium jonesii]|uniref:phosphatidylinositol N-acetylglucosaminyltransferase-domain-containing protein n=1 Tax=Fimicolochytrium jonesii TaxID=1396493 RepID=UPI0022FE3943|nr:phosphatidylinositol N-acetylglucosaminyltransferase-domain-containing protein [Fimicolochytrium jonesii]KAI8821705.1 phosphatidylinositol N-acetylglucosaminyltransferase-domain-containing protein [Fimicolochytrium jonesii]